MAVTAHSHAGDKFYISPTAQNSDLDLTGFNQITSWIEVKGVGNFGEHGSQTNILTHDLWATTVVQKSKGTTNAGDPPLEVAHNPLDPGQAAMTAAGKATNHNAYAFKHEKQSGETVFGRGIVTGPVLSGGRNEDFDLATFTLGLTQEVLSDTSGISS